MPYYDRSTPYTEPERVWCDPCAEKRWGDPYQESDDAFDARYYDASGDYCWAPLWSGSPSNPCRCVECGGPVVPSWCYGDEGRRFTPLEAMGRWRAHCVAVARAERERVYRAERERVARRYDLGFVEEMAR